MKPLHFALLAGLLSLSIGVGMKSGQLLQNRLAEYRQQDEAVALQQPNSRLYIPFNNDTLSGNYLAAHFAQTQYDWQAATTFLDKVLASGDPDSQLIRRTMVIAMGSGDTTRAFALANSLLQKEPTNPLGLMFISIKQLQAQEFNEAKETINKIPTSENVDFIVPVVRGWLDAATGTLDEGRLKDGSIHLYQAIFIADYIKRPDIIEYLIEIALKVDQLTVQDLDKLGDFYVHIGKPEKALPLYEKILSAVPGEASIITKVNAINTKLPINNFKGVKTPQDGVAIAMGDMSETLFQEYSDDSARVFAQMSIFLNPAMTEPRIVMAEIAARHDRLDDAITFYQGVPAGSEDYVRAHRRAADLLEDADRTDDALKELDKIIETHNDAEAMMQAGDIYRRTEDFKKALAYYDRAAATFGETIPPQYWTLYYVRGMAYERLKQWDKAEADLKAALAFQPENPLVLNYLGYAWADQGVNLDESLAMIRKAVSLSPDDGYITDSLGWVLYRRGNFQEAVPHLERAVELLPYDSTINDHLGDAYWRVGRKLEARFQWERAKANAEDPELLAEIQKKLAEGLSDKGDVREARTQASDDTPVKQ